MQTNLAPEYQGTPEGLEAEAILRKCVHCGFCTATCPTYQLLGDELDSPRGRIDLIKQVLEGVEPTRDTHLPQRRAIRALGRHRTPIGRRESAAPRRRANRALGFERRPVIPFVCTCHEAGPVGARLVAWWHQGQSARAPQRWRLAHRHPCPQGVAAGGLCATGDEPQHQQRHGARARCLRHPNRGRTAGGLLWRRQVPLERPRRGACANEKQHRRVVATCEPRG